MRGDIELREGVSYEGIFEGMFKREDELFEDGVIYKVYKPNSYTEVVYSKKEDEGGISEERIDVLLSDDVLSKVLDNELISKVEMEGVIIYCGAFRNVLCGGNEWLINWFNESVEIKVGRLLECAGV